MEYLIIAAVTLLIEGVIWLVARFRKALSAPSRSAKLNLS